MTTGLRTIRTALLVRVIGGGHAPIADFTDNAINAVIIEDGVQVTDAEGGALIDFSAVTADGNGYIFLRQSHGKRRRAQPEFWRTVWGVWG